MLLFDINVTFLFPMIAFEMVRCEGTNKKEIHKIEHTSGSLNKTKLAIADKRTQEGKPLIQKCGCNNGTKIMTQKTIPIMCACMLEDYDKRWAPDGAGSETTVINTFKVISITDVNEAHNLIYSYIK